MVHLQRRFRRQARFKGEDALRANLTSASCEIRREVSPLIWAGCRRGPGDRDLRLGDRSARAGRPEPAGRDIGAQAKLGPGRPNGGRSHQQDRGHDGEADQRQRRRQRREFL